MSHETEMDREFLTNDDVSENAKGKHHLTTVHPFQSSETGTLTFHPFNIHSDKFFLQEIH
jgi:hypothetical protein